jgi:mono/diheme cytochrome c family protein
MNRMHASLRKATLVAAVLGSLALRAAPSHAADEATVKLFNAQCSSCHGKDGRGQTTAGKPLNVKDWTDPKSFKGITDGKIREQIRTGTKGPDGKERMTSFKKLTDEQVTALIAYVHTLAAAAKK